MKLTIDIDCTPAEARAFFGLPDVSGINEVVVDGLRQRTEENLDAFTDPQKFFEMAMSGTAGNMDAMQKMFAGMMATAAGQGKPGV